MTIISKPKDAELVGKAQVRTAAAQLRRHVPGQFTFWPDDRRAIANELARSALFQCGDHRKARRYFDNEALFVLGEGGVTYKGQELRSRDEDIFISLAHCSRDLPSGKMVVKVTSADICKMNNWRLSQAYYTEIFESIQRMKGGIITVFSKRLAKALKCQRALEAGASDAELQALYHELTEFEQADARARQLGLEPPTDTDEMAGMMMSLISGDPVFSGFKSMKNNVPQGNVTWEITLDTKMVSLFAAPYLTFVDLETRQQLSAIGKRLQSYFLSHKKPYPILLRNLAKLLGLNFADKKTLKFTIAKELTTLRDKHVIADYGFQKSKADNDWLVVVHREGPTPTVEAQKD